jgi:hypothetical protein
MDEVVNYGRPMNQGLRGRLKATHRTSLAEFDALFASLQHRAFRGEP